MARALPTRSATSRAWGFISWRTAPAASAAPCGSPPVRAGEPSSLVACGVRPVEIRRVMNGNPSQTSSRSAPKRARILLVDDHPLVRERLAEVINREGDLSVCGEAEDRHQAIEAIKTTA